MAPPTIPYWNLNIPPEQHTAECPSFLRNLNPKDYGIISTPDASFQRTSWSDVRSLIAKNAIDRFQRVPSDLRRYMSYNMHLRHTYGSVMAFVLSERLGWGDDTLAPRGTPFACEEDIKILCNDWPYGIDERIVHLVVWTKFELAEDPATGDLTDKARAEIDAYVTRVFGSHMAQDRYVWFKNWRSLKSVKGVEHFHVMLFDPHPDFVRRLTNGDVPLSLRVQ